MSEPCHLIKSHVPLPSLIFSDITQLGEAIANVIQSSLRLPQRTPLETVYNLKLNNFMGNEGPEGAKQWLNHVEKTYRVMQQLENFPEDRWVETTTWFLGKEAASWRQEFYQLKQGKMSAIEYYRKFIDMSSYCPEIAENPAEMLQQFKWGTRKKWRSMTTTTPCSTHQEFYEILLRVEDYENMPNDSEEEEEKDNIQKKNNNKDKGQSSQGPRKT
ncbi:uncharacterized protein [Pyrus communis]|uniref:uncharacterized protein n=1 Tax=Pyrus communis TaxID=23211 RepID=UPI0035BEB5C8